MFMVWLSARLAKVRAVCAVVTMSIASLALAGCSGGGGGGGSGGGSTNQSVLPATFSASFAEGPPLTSPRGVTSSFQFYAPTNDAATLALIGVDATNFVVLISPSEPNASGFRTITWTIQTSTVFDYENPQDQNRDNVYSFQFRMEYRGQTLTSEVSVNITDIADGISVQGVTIEGEAVNQQFGGHIFAIPDISGDGRPELGASVQSGLGPATAYIIGSEFYGSVSTGPLSIANLGSQGTRFSQAATGAPAIPTPSSLKPNYLSALKHPDGAGVDVLLSDGVKRKFYLFQIEQPSDYAPLKGSIDPDTVTNAIVYTPPPGSPEYEARLVGDVNGDGHNDIYVRPVHMPFSPGGSVTSGIILGRPATSAADRARPAVFDISFTSGRMGEGLNQILAQTIGDISGDGFADLLLYFPVDSSINGLLPLVRSPILRGPTPRTVSLQFATADPVSVFTGNATTSIFEIDDVDSDGFRSLYISGSVIDGDDLHAAAGSNILSLEPPTLTNAVGTGGYLTAIGDVDGDTIGDFIQMFDGQKGPQVVRGALLRRGLRDVTPPDPAILGSKRIELKAINYTFFQSQHPAYLNTAGLVAFGAASSDFSATTLAATSGKIVLVKEEDIRRAVVTPTAGGAFNGGLTVN